VIVNSDANEDPYSRTLVRQSWLTKANAHNTLASAACCAVQARFMLGISSTAARDAANKAEGQRYGDILYTETPEGFGPNVARKMRRGLQLALNAFRALTHLMKTDSDCWLNVLALQRILPSLELQNLYAGNAPTLKRTVQTSGRYMDHGWYPTALGKGAVYPPFHSGAAMLFSTDVVRFLAHPPLPHRLGDHDDVDIGIALFPFNLTRRKIEAIRLTGLAADAWPHETPCLPLWRVCH
jgi:hypothetical protein